MKCLITELKQTEISGCHKRLHIVPTAIGRIPLSGFKSGVRGAEATNSAKLEGHLPHSHKLTTDVIACKSSLAITKRLPIFKIILPSYVK